jgi:hypothetical protein
MHFTSQGIAGHHDDSLLDSVELKQIRLSFDASSQTNKWKSTPAALEGWQYSN